MKQIIINIILAVCILMPATVVKAQTPANPVGKWTYEIPEAPPEYGLGKVEFKRVDGKLTMAMMTAGNPEISMEVTEKENNGVKEYVCTFSSDQFEMTLRLKPNGENLTGVLEVAGYEASILMKPDKE